MSLLNAIIATLGFGKRQKKVSPSDVVLITGCDSGLGFAFAKHCYALNMTVLAACHQSDSEGARLLRAVNDPVRMRTLQLDLLEQASINRVTLLLASLLENRGAEDSYRLAALVNNAGVMCFGEFEWQTRAQIESQINVNVIGTMLLTKELLPLIRQHSARIINITSHCSFRALAGVSVYGASKAALRSWNDALRTEMVQYGVPVVNLVPGSFVLDTNICARQTDHASAMLSEMTVEERNFYGAYFKRFNDYLSVLAGFKRADQVRDDVLLSKFTDALLSTVPRALYIHEPWRYTLYHALFAICPAFISDWLTVRFCAIPRFVPEEAAASQDLEAKSKST